MKSIECPNCGHIIKDADLVQPDLYFPIVGYTKRENGNNYYNTIPIGSPIYEMEDGRIFILQNKIDNSDPYQYPVIYRRESLYRL